jgi:SAM-dependent methyltransferase
MEVMEHLADPDPLLDECFRVVRPAGQLVFSCPNYCNFFLGVKLLSDLGIPFFSRYIGRQFIDRTTTSFELRRRLAKRGQILTQRAIRLHPPLFEQVDYRVRPGARLHRINDWIFQLEGRWGEQPPLSFLGLHTMCRVRKAPDSAG